MQIRDRLKRESMCLQRCNSKECLQVLEDLQSDPKTQQQHLAHPQIRANIEKLVSAGIVQMR